MLAVLGDVEVDPKVTEEIRHARRGDSGHHRGGRGQARRADETSTAGRINPSAHARITLVRQLACAPEDVAWYKEPDSMVYTRDSYASGTITINHEYVVRGRKEC